MSHYNYMSFHFQLFAVYLKGGEVKHSCYSARLPLHKAAAHTF